MDYGFGAGAYWFSSTEFPSFSGAFLEPVRIEFHPTTNMKKEHPWAAAIPSVRLAYLVFPGVFETVRFGATPGRPTANRTGLGVQRRHLLRPGRAVQLNRIPLEARAIRLLRGLGPYPQRPYDTMTRVAEQPTEIDRELTVLEAELKRLEAEYNMFFAGRLPRPPWETRGRVDAMVKRLDRIAHHQLPANVQVRDASIPVPDVRRSLGSWAARARGGTARARSHSRARPARPSRSGRRTASCTSRRSRPDAGDGQAARSVRQPRRRAARCRRRAGAVPQVRRPDQDAGRRVEGEGQSGGGVSRGGEGREGRLYGAGVPRRAARNDRTRTDECEREGGAA